MDGGDNQALGNGSSTGGSRWNPTKEQITYLEGMYRQGMRTPTAVEIQQITEKLKAFGSIEGKNVFYWFQNHKARQRQKQKQKLQQQQQHNFGYVSRVHHQIINPPLMFPTPHQNGVVCSPYYLAQLTGDTSCLYQQCPKVPLSASAGRGPFIRPSRASSERYNTPMQGKKETLDLFPIHPTGALQSGIHENGYKNPSYCCDDLEKDGDHDDNGTFGGPGHAFIDFFSCEN